MKVAYFDCFSGAAGDMIVASLLDAGLCLGDLQRQLALLPLSGYSVRAEKVHRAGLAGTKFHVELAGAEGQADPGAQAHAHGGEHHSHDDHDHNHDHAAGHDHDHDHAPVPAPAQHVHRGLTEILALLDQAALPAPAKQLAKSIFTRLGQAEARVHGVAVADVHFHEVGAVDSIVDIVGAALALHLMGVEKVYCSPIHVGNGRVKMAHGLLPVPAPATAELLRGVPLARETSDQIVGELTTPTGAAILTGVQASFGPLPAMTVEAIGYGAGSRDNPNRPNLLRVFLGELSDAASADSVVELACNLDDASGQIIAAAMESLLASGALDAWAVPIYMKKSRPAWTLYALASPGDVAKLEHCFFEHTTTLGVRRHVLDRTTLQRRHESVETPYGPIRIKIGRSGQADVNAAPEFADCAAAAGAHGVAVKEVIQAALDAYRRQA